MVRKLHLITRCGSTMAAGTTLSGLLHGRRHTPTPSIIPPRTPKAPGRQWHFLNPTNHRANRHIPLFFEPHHPVTTPTLDSSVVVLSTYSLRRSNG